MSAEGQKVSTKSWELQSTKPGEVHLDRISRPVFYFVSSNVSSLKFNLSQSQP